MRHVLSWHLTSSPTVNSDDAIFMRQETGSMCRMECFSVLFTKFYYFLLILKIISWNWLAILHLYPRWSSQQHIYILFTLSSFFVCLHISPQTEGVRTLQIMSKTSHRAKIHRTGGQNPSYRGQKSNIPCYNNWQHISSESETWFTPVPINNVPVNGRIYTSSGLNR